MKKILLSTVLLFAVLLLNAQQIQRCGTTNYIDILESQYPGFKQATEDAFNNAKSVTQKTQSVYRIPVVFHVVWNSSSPEENLADSVIHRQIEIMNQGFRGTNPDGGNVRPEFGMTASDSQIEFYLATTDPNGQATDGIVRMETTTEFEGGIFGLPDNAKVTADGGSDAWDTEKYMNIWVIDMADSFFGVSLLGYAYPPADLANWPAGNTAPSPELEGVVVQYQMVSDNNPTLVGLGNTFADYDFGRTAIHEVGHYLGLRHVWGDGNCNEDDGISDTPPMASNSQQTGCDVTKNTCNTATSGGAADLSDMWENYMDYSEESCQVLFTPEQIDLMTGVLEDQRGELTTWDGVANNDLEDISNIIAIYPNPSNGTFNLNWVMESNDSMEIEIVDVMGRTVYVSSYVALSGQNSLNINVNLADGYYFLNMKSLSITATKKVVIH